jgi:hypothetical protein
MLVPGELLELLEDPLDPLDEPEELELDIEPKCN